MERSSVRADRPVEDDRPGEDRGAPRSERVLYEALETNVLATDVAVLTLKLPDGP